MFDSKMEYLCSYAATLSPDFEEIGVTPEGLRINIYVTGGIVSGPKINGLLRPVGADWLTIRNDGVAILDVRATIETHDKALIYISYTGVGETGVDGYQRFLDGNPPTVFPLRCASRMQTSHPDYLWVNRLQCVNIGEADLSRPTASYDVYALA